MNTCIYSIEYIIQYIRSKSKVLTFKVFSDLLDIEFSSTESVVSYYYLKIPINTFQIIKTSANGWTVLDHVLKRLTFF